VNEEVPRGPDVGFHMAPCDWLMVYSKVLDSERFEHGTFFQPNALGKVGLPFAPSYCLLYHSCFKLYKVFHMVERRQKGAGA
jgi:hypothetical protein